MARMLQATVRAIRRRAVVFVLVVAAIAALNLVLPPLVLSVARKPYDYFSINPWLHNLPSWLRSGEATAGRKLDFVWNAAVLWFVASGQSDAPEWGFTATVSDFARWILIGVLFGTYFTLWLERRACARGHRRPPRGRGWRGGGGGGRLGSPGAPPRPRRGARRGAPPLPAPGRGV